MPLIARTAALIAIVVLGAHLRFTGLAWGARHPMHSDERVYVENVVAMIDAGDFDHRFYTYPALFYYVLRSAITLLPEDRRHSSDAYILARVVVATFGLLNIALLAFIAGRWFGPPTGLIAALLAAISPVDVYASHQARPDVLLQSFGLIGIVAIGLVGMRARHDALAGVAIGLASAIKFTGLLLVPSYVLARLMRPGPRVRGLLLAGMVTIAVALICTPYALIHLAEYQQGPPRQLQQYYPRPVTADTVIDRLLFFLDATRNALGWLGSTCAAIGAVLLLRRSMELWLPALLYPLVTIIVMATGHLVFERYVLPSIDVLYIAAAFCIARTIAAAGRWRWLGVPLLSLVAVLQVRESRAIVEPLARPSAQDRALDWILANARPGARILETRPAARLGATAGAMVGIPADRFEAVFSYTDQDRSALLSMLERHVDLVLLNPGEGWKELQTLYRALDAFDRPEILLKAPVEPPAYALVPLTQGDVTAAPPDLTGALSDGSLATAWSTAEPLRGTEWIRVAFSRPVRVGRIELVVPAVFGTYDPEIAVETAIDGRELKRVTTIPLRPGLRDQSVALGPFSQDILLKPRPIRGLRLLQLGARPYRWAVSELRIYERLRDEVDE